MRSPPYIPISMALGYLHLWEPLAQFPLDHGPLNMCMRREGKIETIQL